MNEDLKAFLAPSYFSPFKITRQQLKESMLYAAKNHASGNLIDLGCGMKPYESLFAPYITSYFGVDHEGAAQHNYGQQTKADLFISGVSTGLPEASYDTVLTSQVLEHIAEPSELLHEAWRLLKPGGKLIMTTPLVWEEHAEPYDFYRYTRYGLQHLVQKAQFKMLELQPIGGALAMIIQTFIVSVFYASSSNLIVRGFRKLLAYPLMPVLNWQGLYLDKLIKNDKITLNYLVIATKPKS